MKIYYHEISSQFLRIILFTILGIKDKCECKNIIETKVNDII